MKVFFGLRPCVLSLMLLQTQILSAQTIWLPAGAGDWTIPGNWSAGVPTFAIQAQINNGGTAQLTANAVGNANAVRIGNGVGQSGSVLVDHSTLAQNNGLFVGNAGTGNLTVQNGGTVNSASLDNIATLATAVGNAIVTNPGSNWNMLSLNVGGSGNGTLNVSDGGQVHTNGSGIIGNFLGSVGQATVEGTGSLWSINGFSFLIGNAGIGTLNISDGGQVISTSAAILGTGTGTLNLDGTEGHRGLLTVPELQGNPGVQANFDGGTLQTTANNPTFINNFTTGELNILSGGLFLDSQAFDIGTTNNFTGVGTLTKLGSGTFTYDGISTNAGGVAVNEGQFILNGTISNASTVNNSGILQVNAAGVISAPVTVNDSGNLTVDGLVTGLVTTNNSGILLGTGTVGSIDNFGFLSPGDSNAIGTLHVTGNHVNESTGTHLNELNAAGQTDLLIVNGTSTLKGGTLDLIAAPGNYLAGTTYTLITATGGLAGEFATVISNLPIHFFLKYLPNSLVLTLGNAINPHGLKGNPRRVADYINTFPTISGDFLTVYNELLTLNLPELSRALDQLHPAPFQAQTITTADTAHLVNDSFIDRLQFLRTTQCDPCSQGGAWIAGLADYVRFNKVQGLRGFTATNGGVAIGYDRCLCDNLIAGVGAAYSNNSLRWNHSYGHSEGDLYYYGAYVTKYNSDYYIDGSILGYNGKYHSKRHIHFAAIDRRAKSKQSIYGVNPHIGAGWILNTCGIDVIPFGEVDYYYVNQGKFHEHGADSLNLHVKRHDASSVRLESGLRFAKTYDCDCGSFLPYVSISYVGHRYYGRKYKSSFNDQAANFAVFGTDRCFNQAEFGVGFAYLINDTFAINTNYEIDFGSKRQEQEFNFELSYRF